MFQLEPSIKQWKRDYLKNPGITESVLYELENHLRDLIESRMEMGSDAETAFHAAVADLGDPNHIGDEFDKSTRRKQFGRPDWPGPQWMPDLVVNAIKMAMRSIKKQWGYSLFHILGLGVALTACLLIFLYIRFELSYDAYHDDFQRIHRLQVDIAGSSGTTRYAMTPPPAGPELANLFPQIEKMARIFYFDTKRRVKQNDHFYYEEGFVYADPEIFNLLSVTFLEGEAQTALTEPMSVVIPRRLAEKYFGDAPALNRLLVINNRDYKVTGVVENAPANTHMPFDIFVSMMDLGHPPWLTDWTWPGMYTYVKLSENVRMDEFNRQIRPLGKNNYQANSNAAGKEYSYELTPISSIHLHSNCEYELTETGHVDRLYIFASVGLFILIIATINYVNMSTARSIRRAKEVGIRKVAGASRGQVMRQFFFESMILCLVSMIIAIVSAYFLSPAVHKLTGIGLESAALFQWQYLLMLIFLTLFIGFISGIYPALVLSSFHPLQVLKGHTRRVTGRAGFRKGLVIIQFSLSILLIIGSLTVYRQWQYMQSMDMGFNPENKIVFELSGRSPLERNHEQVKTAFSSIPGVRGVTVSGSVPGQGAGSLRTRLASGQGAKDQMMYYQFWDDAFLQEYEVSLAAGTSFSKNRPTSLEDACLINRAAVESFGFSNPQSALGQKVISGLTNETLRIIGVVEGYHFRSVQTQIEPLVIDYLPPFFTHITLNLDETDSKTVNAVESAWKELFPGEPFDFFYLEEFIDTLYQTQRQTGHLFGGFTFMGIAIACLGLLGLSSFLMEQRTKEIGIRKTLGASTSIIALMLSREFILWVVSANVIAWPLGYFLMKNWLAGFAYQARLSISVFLLASAAALVLAALTVGLHAVKTATASPIDAIRYE